MGHFGLHDLVGRTGIAGEDETLCEGGIEATMGGLGKPDEVFRTIVGGDAVEVVTIVGMQMPRRDLGGWRQPFDGSGSDESKGDGMMDEDAFVGSKSIRKTQVALFASRIGFVFRVLVGSRMWCKEGFDTVDDTATL